MPERIILEGKQALVTGGDGAETRAEIVTVVGALHQASIQGFDQEALADNLKWKVTCGPLTVCIVELKPQLRRITVIDGASAVPFGPEATYRECRLAFPFVVLKVPFLKGKIVGRVELFYRNQPLRDLDDVLYWPNLLNVSPHAYGCVAWLCTQYLRHERPAPGITAGLDAVIHHLFGGGFNLSSEMHEGQSCFSKAQADQIDARVTDLDRWEAESLLDPRFVLQVEWKPVGLTVRKLIETELNFCGVAQQLATTADVVSALMSHRNGRKRGTP
jgi:hypothetical protein